MALASVLSAVRELILDEVDLPDTVQERMRSYRTRFADLTQEEIEDLAKMEPGRLALYTHSIFSAEASILKTYFPATLALVAKHHESVTGISYDPIQFVRSIHSAFPWRGIHSDTLGRCLIQYLSHEGVAFAAAEPGLPDMAELEQASLEIRRAMNVEPKPQENLDGPRLASMTVESLLETGIEVPELVHRLECQFRVLEARIAFMEADKIHPPSIVPGTCSLVGGRPHDFGAQWVAVPEAVATLIETLRDERDETGSTVGRVAGTYVETVIDQSESEVFTNFISMLGELVRAGVIIVKYQEP